MREAFKPGTKVQFKMPDGTMGAVAEITNDVPDGYIGRYWTVPGYAGNGFYFVRVVLDNRRLLAHESDLVIIDGP